MKKAPILKPLSTLAIVLSLACSPISEAFSQKPITPQTPDIYANLNTNNEWITDKDVNALYDLSLSIQDDTSPNSELANTLSLPSKTMLEELSTEFELTWNELKKELEESRGEFDTYMNQFHENIWENNWTKDGLQVAQAWFSLDDIWWYLSNSKRLLIILVIVLLANAGGNKARDAIWAWALKVEWRGKKIVSWSITIALLALAFWRFERESLDKAIKKWVDAIGFIPPKYRDAFAEWASDVIDQWGKAVSATWHALWDNLISEWAGTTAHVLCAIIAFFLWKMLANKAGTTWLKKRWTVAAFVTIGRFFMPMAYDAYIGVRSSNGRSIGWGSWWSVYGGEETQLSIEDRIDLRKKSILQPNGISVTEVTTSNTACDDLFNLYFPLTEAKSDKEISWSLVLKNKKSWEQIKNRLHIHCSIQKDSDGKEHRFMYFSTQDASGWRTAIISWGNGVRPIEIEDEKWDGWQCPSTYFGLYKKWNDPWRISYGAEWVKDITRHIPDPLRQIIFLSNNRIPPK